MYLDDHPNLSAQVAYGDVGRHGDLGYEGQKVHVRGMRFAHALSAHAPSTLRLELDGRFRSFSCHAALNDDVPREVSWADFFVRVDEEVRALANFVRPGDPPRRLEVPIKAGRELVLVSETSKREHCHTVWLDPLLSDTDICPMPEELTDPLNSCFYSSRYRISHAWS